MMMMMQNMNYPAAKTAEIMSRYRPIAPKPSPSPHEDIIMSQQQHFWPQSGPLSRRRKRGRTSISPISFKRTLRPTNQDGDFGHNESLVTLPLLSSDPDTVVVVDDCGGGDEGRAVDLSGIKAEISEENGESLVLQLQGPVKNGAVISPKPMRPVGSSVHVGCIDKVVISEDDTKSIHALDLQVSKKAAEDVEWEVETEPLPAIVSDSKNKVRLTNGAYKEMVGQPECAWLDSMVGSGPCARIGGEVMLRLLGFNVPAAAKGFSCWVRIEWGNVEEKSVLMRFVMSIGWFVTLKDYMFAWRFHTGNSHSL